jgi:PucR family transcriptional regulator, purine catabolism regulatory protein
VATLAELRAAVFPGVRDVGAKTPKPPRDVAWVRVMKARVPAFDALDAGDVAIVPASALDVVAPSPGDLDALVTALAGAPVAAIVLVDADDTSASLATRLESLAVAARSAGLVAWRVPRGDAAAIERSVIGYLVNRRAELEHQAALLEARLEALALAGADIDALVAAIAEFLGRAVIVEVTRGNALASHAPIGTAAAAAIAAYHRDERRVALRVPLPGADGAAAAETATLVLPGDAEATELERATVERIAGFLALELARDEALRRARDTTARGEQMPPAGPPWIVLVARQRSPGDATTAEEREQTRRDVRLIAPARRMALRGDADSLELRAIVAVDASDPDGTILARRVASSLRRPVAVSRPIDDASQRPAAEADARATLEAIESLREPPTVARADRLAAYRLLGNLHNVPDGRRLARALLRPVLEGRADVRREHLATLRAVIDQPGLAEAAAALGVHRNTIAYRVRRIEELTGWRLTDPELRLPLAMAVRLVQEDQI